MDGTPGVHRLNDDAQRTRGRYRGLRYAGRTVLALISIAALAGQGFLWSTLREVRTVVPTTDVLGGPLQQGAPPVDDGAQDILVVGSDTRTDTLGNPLPLSVLKELRTEANAGVNTDTIIMLRIPHNGARPSVVSVPRDTYVPIPGYREDKINAALGATKSRASRHLEAEGGHDPVAIERESDRQGRSTLVQTVQNLTGVRVDHYAEVNLYGFYLLTKAVGGVEVCLKQSTKDPDSGANFRAGRQIVSGGAALSYVRQRENLPRGDLDRIVRQQTFLSSAMRKLLSTGTLTDPGKLTGLMEVVRKAVVVDPGMDVLELLRHFGTIAAGAVEFVTIPVVGSARNERGQSVLTVDSARVKEVVGGLVAAQSALPEPGFTGPRKLRMDGAADPLVRVRASRQDDVPCVY